MTTRERTIRGQVAVVGVGETTYYKHGRAPESEFALALQAILRACDDAGIDPRQVDGFASYSNDRNDPSRLAAALGLPELRFSNMQWGGGGGGGSAAVGNAAAAVAAGYADCVVVFRALAQGQFQRFGAAPPGGTVSGEAALTFPYGLISPAQRFAMRVMRFMHDHGVRQEAQRAIALASYHHAQANPRAVMHGRPLTRAARGAEPKRPNCPCASERKTTTHEAIPAATAAAALPTAAEPPAPPPPHCMFEKRSSGRPSAAASRDGSFRSLE